MKTQTRAAAVAISLALVTFGVGCSDASARDPIAPTPTPTPTNALYTLSGVVFEATSAGNMPVEGVEVYCEPCGPATGGHSFRFTDSAGFYSFDGAGGVAASGFLVRLAKEGYKLPNVPDESGPTGLGSMGSVPVRITGDTRLDIQIVRK